jgi:rhamnosyltransferase
MKLAAVIVCYYPDAQELKRNIASCINYIDKLILWENTPKSNIKNEGLYIEQYGNKALQMSLGKNVGIATALNEAARWCKTNGFSHILTLDQDSYFLNDTLAQYRLIITELNKAETDVGMYAVNPVCEKRPNYPEHAGTIEVADAITSGSIIPLSIFDTVGFFRDDLFIDAVDYEFCYRLKRAGYKTIVISSVLMQHKVGYLKKISFGLSTVNYSAFRSYFIVRNQILMWKLYPNLFSTKHKKTLIKHHILFRIAKILLGEAHKRSKIKAIINGISDGLTGKTKHEPLH